MDNIIQRIQDTDIEFSINYFMENIAEKGYLLSTLMQNVSEAVAQEDAKTVFLQAPIILQAVTEAPNYFRSDEITDTFLFNMKLYAHMVLKSAFQFDIERVEENMERLDSTSRAFGNLFDSEMFEDSVDTISWLASSPEYTFELINQMENNQFYPDRIISLGHSGNRPGYMLAEVMGTGAYTFKMRTYDRDSRDRLFLADEVDYLKRYFDDASILIYDEDTNEGGGLSAVKSIVQSKFNPYDVLTSTSFVTSPSYQGSIDFVGKQLTSHDLENLKYFGKN